MVLQGGTSPWLKITLREVHWDVSLGETPVRCIPGMLFRTGTPLWDMALGRRGWSSLISPPLSDLVYFIMRTVVIWFCFPPLLLFLNRNWCWHFWVWVFLIGETEKWCEEEGKSQNSHLPSSSCSLSERQGRVPVPYMGHGQPAPAVVLPRCGRVTSYAQQISPGVSWLSVPLVPFQSPRTS